MKSFIGLFQSGCGLPVSVLSSSVDFIWNRRKEEGNMKIDPVLLTILSQRNEIGANMCLYCCLSEIFALRIIWRECLTATWTQQKGKCEFNGKKLNFPCRKFLEVTLFRSVWGSVLWTIPVDWKAIEDVFLSIWGASPPRWAQDSAPRKLPISDSMGIRTKQGGRGKQGLISQNSSAWKQLLNLSLFVSFCLEKRNLLWPFYYWHEGLFKTKVHFTLNSYILFKPIACVTDVPISRVRIENFLF